jgi:hypothetical protein
MDCRQDVSKSIFKSLSKSERVLKIALAKALATDSNSSCVLEMLDKLFIHLMAVTFD